MSIHAGKAILTASDRWVKAGGDHNSLLQAAMLGKIGTGVDARAAMAGEIHDQIIASNRFKREAEPLDGSAIMARPFDKIVSTVRPTMAAAFDENRGVDAKKDIGSLSHAVEGREITHSLSHKTEGGLVIPAKTVYNLAAYVFANGLTAVAGAAVLAHGGPMAAVAAYFAEAAVVFGVECMVIALGTGTALIGGGKSAHGAQTLEDTLHGYGVDVSALGISQEELEKNREYRKQVNAKTLSPENKALFDAAMKNMKNEMLNTLKEGITIGLTGAIAAGDKVAQSELTYLQTRLENLFTSSGNKPINMQALQAIMTSRPQPFNAGNYNTPHG